MNAHCYLYNCVNIYTIIQLLNVSLWLHKAQIDTSMLPNSRFTHYIFSICCWQRCILSGAWGAYGLDAIPREVHDTPRPQPSHLEVSGMVVGSAVPCPSFMWRLPAFIGAERRCTKSYSVGNVSPRSTWSRTLAGFFTASVKGGRLHRSQYGSQQSQPTPILWRTGTVMSWHCVMS